MAEKHLDGIELLPLKHLNRTGSHDRKEIARQHSGEKEPLKSPRLERSQSHHRTRGKYESVNVHEERPAEEHFEEFEVIEEGVGSQSEENGGHSNVTLALASIVASGVQFGWALQLSLLTPYIQVGTA